MSSRALKKNVAHLIIRCLENEGVEYIFGLPGEENIDLIEALDGSSIRFILTRHEQGASFMADLYGRLTRRAGVCLATLGPGAINLILGTADAFLDSSPLVALAAQADTTRLDKESHQAIDLVQLFSPVTKWCAMATQVETVPEMIRKAFKLAQSERCGATALIIPEDIAAMPAEKNATPIPVKQPLPTRPNPDQIQRAAELINQSKHVVVLAGHGVCRSNACSALKDFADHIQAPVATTFMAKGAMPHHHPLSMGTIGFMKHDVINFGLDTADTVICIGYDLVEYSPSHWHPKKDKNIIHIHGTPAEVDSYYTPTVGIQGEISASLEALQTHIKPREETIQKKIKTMLHTELTKYDTSDDFPLKPQRIVSDIRAALSPEDIVLCDTGALKMWMARLYPCEHPNTCLISNALATMAFSLPGALAAKLAFPERRILATMGDGAFMMNSQELETAKRENIPFVVLIWRDEHYGLIRWKQDMHFSHSSHVQFENPDFVAYAESFGIDGYRIEKAADLLPTLEKALETDQLAVIDCPVDYSENMALIKKLGHLTHTI